MLKKMAALLAVLLLLPVFALAEDTVLVDAITKPEAEEGFAFAQDAELLEIVFPQILDCDAALIRCGGKTMLIDCATGQQADRVVNMLAQMGVTELNYVVNTHPHYDHIQGFPTIADAVKVHALYVCFPENETDHMTTVIAQAAEREIPVVWFGDGSRFELGGTVMDVWMKCDESCNLNERSAQIRMQFGNRTALFTADMQKKTQQALMEHIDPALLDIDLMKYPHHGKRSLQNEFVALTTPLFAVVTNNGGKSSYEGRKCLGYKHIPYANTVPGYVYCVTDGETWLVKRLDMDKPVGVTSRPDTRDYVP